jgi:hypothetical protein
MNTVRRYISEKQAEIAQHPFFARLEGQAAFESTMDFVAGMTFWVFVFQDILRLNEARMVDPVLGRIARHHRSEDRGHDSWFLDDLDKLDPSPRDYRWLFGQHHAQTRDAAYALISEVFRASNDHVRILLLLTLESAGHVFFERSAEFVSLHGADKSLRYFSSTHLEVEKDHSMFEAEMMKPLDVELSPSVRAEALAMVDRCYAAFDLLFSGLESRVVRRASGNLSVPAPANRPSGDPGTGGPAEPH